MLSTPLAIVKDHVIGTLYWIILHAHYSFSSVNFLAYRFDGAKSAFIHLEHMIEQRDGVLEQVQ
jgi:hypothetical protein